ncbi:MAG TPA: hypothetical protein VGB94_01180, partial [Acidobacteriaceae bacterium]
MKRRLALLPTAAALLAAVVLLALPFAAHAQTPVRIGYFPNITHSQALVGQANGQFQKDFGSSANIQWIQFNAGPSVIEA